MSGGSNPAYAPPPPDWQTAARQAVTLCQRNLWSPGGLPARRYLLNRGLREITLRRFQLGYSPGAKFAGLWAPRGVVIPCSTGSMEADSLEIWYLKVRLLPAEPCRCPQPDCRASMPGPGTCPQCGKTAKFLGVKGNRTAAVFAADGLRNPLKIGLFVEGEFDAMIGWQEMCLEGGLPVASLGSATNLPDLAAWGELLAGLRLPLVAYHADPAGQQGAAAVLGLLPRTRIVPMPEGVKDLNEFYLAGGDLWGWVRPYLEAIEQSQPPGAQ